MCVNPWYNDKVHSFIPCGGCLGCRLDSVSLWSARALSELKKGRNAFVTFTYDNLHLPYSSSSSLIPTLKNVDNKKFLDNLRKQIKSIPSLPFGSYRDFKYYSVGEYGDTFSRPHYHILFFGLDFHDFSGFFSRIWKNGSVDAEPVNVATIRYVLDYMFKSVSGSYAVDLYDSVGRERPFSSCSKHFGFDFFYSRADEINSTGFVKLASRFVPVPTYFKNMLCKRDFNSIQSRADVAYSIYKDNLDVALNNGFDTLDDFLNYRKSVFQQSNFIKSVNAGRGVDVRYIPNDIYACENLLSNFV